jgi:hypothetical protein
MKMMGGMKGMPGGMPYIFKISLRNFKFITNLNNNYMVLNVLVLVGRLLKMTLRL